MRQRLEKAEIRALKSLFRLPIHTPTVAILFTFGTLYTKQRIDKIQLVYLQKILLKKDDEWIKKTFMILKDQQIGWVRNIISILEEYKLPTDLNEIKFSTINEWKQKVNDAVELKNKERLLQDCHKTYGGQAIPKTKTKHLIAKINCAEYTRKPDPNILHMTKLQTKTLIVARFSILECGKNFGRAMGGQ